LFAATDRVRALVVVLVTAHDEVDAVFVKQRDPFLADPEVCAVETPPEDRAGRSSRLPALI
jgi:hypothetical protein